jgi:hypothetical protein
MIDSRGYRVTAVPFHQQKVRTMCGHSLDLTIKRILADELVQLAMASDGVTKAELQHALEQAHQAIIRRDNGRRLE